MLIYLNEGLRRYSQSPVFRYPRGAVEFQAVLEGRARPERDEVAYPKTSCPCLWVHGPESDHGWTDEPDGISRVLVFQFSEVSPILTRALGADSYLTKPLSVNETQRLQQLLEELRPHARKMQGLSSVWMDKAKAELTLLALEGVSAERLHEPGDPARVKVEQALAWYRERMPEGPTVRDVAAAVYVSPAHLRRLFAQVTGRSPHACFHELRMAEGLRRLREGRQRVSEISDLLGFSEPSAFTRAFRAQYRTAPSTTKRPG